MKHILDLAIASLALLVQLSITIVISSLVVFNLALPLMFNQVRPTLSVKTL